MRECHSLEFWVLTGWFQTTSEGAEKKMRKTHFLSTQRIKIKWNAM